MENIYTKRQLISIAAFLFGQNKKCGMFMKNGKELVVTPTDNGYNVTLNGECIYNGNNEYALGMELYTKHN